MHNQLHREEEEKAQVDKSEEKGRKELPEERSIPVKVRGASRGETDSLSFNRESER